MVLGTGFFSAFGETSIPAGNLAAVLLPLVLAGTGIMVAILASFFVRVRKGGSPQTAPEPGRIRGQCHYGGGGLRVHSLDAARKLDCHDAHCRHVRLHISRRILCGRYRTCGGCYYRPCHRIFYFHRHAANPRHCAAEYYGCGHEYHCRAGRRYVFYGHSGACHRTGDHRRILVCGTVRHSHCGSRHAFGDRHSARGGRVRSDFGQCRRHSGDGTPPAGGARANRSTGMRSATPRRRLARALPSGLPR